MSQPFKKDLTGLRFNSWTVLAFTGKKGRHIYWRARCACGLEKDVESYNLTSGRSKACRPCSTALVGTSIHLKHGRSKTKLYRAWQSMKTRCYNAKQEKMYRYHGALGIRVADQWLNNFEAFAAHIGEPPSPHHTVDRIDAFGHYEPGNVRWATQHEQMANTRRHAIARGALAPGRGRGAQA